MPSQYGDHELIRGDALEVLKTLPDDSFDGVFTDPPYGIGNHEPTVDELVAYLNGSDLDTGGDFMGHDWQVPSIAVWRETLRVLKPGGYLLSYGGSRTGYLITLGIRAAGFEIRDQLLYLHAKGMPKNQNVPHAVDSKLGHKRKTVDPIVSPLAKAYANHGTALKPAYEPLVLARKPLIGTMGENIVEHGTGALDIGATRIGSSGATKKGAKPTTKTKNAFGDGLNGGNVVALDDTGRWPANVMFDEAAAEHLDQVVGERPSRKSITRNGGGNAGGPVFEGRKAGTVKADSGYDETGGPSRFFFTAKVSTKEREFGCEHLTKKSAGEATGGRNEGSDGLKNARAGAGRTGGAHNHHPTLKGLKLNEYMASLIKPPTEAVPDSTLLVLYSGAGSEVIGALKAGWRNVIGIERDLDDEGNVAGYIEIAEARIKAWCGGEEKEAA